MTDIKYFFQTRLLHMAQILGLCVLVFIGGVYVGQNGFFSQFLPQSSSNLVNSPLYQDVQNYIKTQYFYKKVDTQNLYYSSIKGMVESLNDPATIFLSPSDESKFEQASSGDTFAGIGVELGYKDNNIIVQRILPGSPSISAGLLVGDQLIAVDGKATIGVDISNVVDEIRGPQGSSVKLSIKDIKSGNNQDISIKRQPIHIDSMYVQNLGFVNGKNTDELVISRFTDSSYQAWQSKWDSMVLQIQKDNPDALIIDLRGNPGGYFDAAIYALSDFLPQGSVGAMQQDRDGNKVKYLTQTSPRFLATMKTEILVNENTASAAEIFSGAMQYYKRANVIGVNTYGKGTAQKVINFGDGSSLHLTTDHWLLPSGRWIQKSDPIHPDYSVSYSNTDFQQGNDPQLIKAEGLI